MTAPNDEPREVQDLLPAWQELGDALRAFFARRVPASDVDDLLQECFLKVSQGLADLEHRERLGGWVFRIARNLVVDHLRRRQRQLQEWIDQEIADGDGHGGGQGAAEPDLDRRVARWLASFVDELPPRYAEVLRLSELEGLRHREIAERLDLSVSGVKSRVQRGRALLRGKLLACCTFEFDRRGSIQDYRRNTPGSCDC